METNNVLDYRSPQAARATRVRTAEESIAIVNRWVTALVFVTLGGMMLFCLYRMPVGR